MPSSRPSSPSNSNNQGPTGSNQPINIVSGGLTAPPPIVNYTLNETIDISGAIIHNRIGTAADGTEVVQTTFDTDVSGTILTLNENLVEVVQSYYNDEVNPNDPRTIALNQIKDYAVKIQCDDFQGKGTVSDYTELFKAASKIANDAKQMQLDVDIDGFNDFGAAADNLSALFSSFTVKLQSVSIIDDLAFLQAISAALAKIYNLSEVFGRFKETILVTSSVQLPKSSHDAASTIQNVMSEVNCAMNYINYFVNPVGPAPVDANLSASDRNIITQAVLAIDNWSTLCDMGVTIAMKNDPDVIYISTASSQLKSKASVLTSNTAILHSTLAGFKLIF